MSAGVRSFLCKSVFSAALLTLKVLLNETWNMTEFLVLSLENQAIRGTFCMGRFTFRSPKIMGVDFYTWTLLKGWLAWLTVAGRIHMKSR